MTEQSSDDIPQHSKSLGNIKHRTVILDGVHNKNKALYRLGVTADEIKRDKALKCMGGSEETYQETLMYLTHNHQPIASKSIIQNMNNIENESIQKQECLEIEYVEHSNTAETINQSAMLTRRDSGSTSYSMTWTHSQNQFNEQSPWQSNQSILKDKNSQSKEDNYGGEKSKHYNALNSLSLDISNEQLLHELDPNVLAEIDIIVDDTLNGPYIIQHENQNNLIDTNDNMDIKTNNNENNTYQHETEQLSSKPKPGETKQNKKKKHFDDKKHKRRKKTPKLRKPKNKKAIKYTDNDDTDNALILKSESMSKQQQRALWKQNRQERGYHDEKSDVINSSIKVRKLFGDDPQQNKKLNWKIGASIDEIMEARTTGITHITEKDDYIRKTTKKQFSRKAKLMNKISKIKQKWSSKRSSSKNNNDNEDALNESVASIQSVNTTVVNNDINTMTIYTGNGKINLVEVVEEQQGLNKLLSESKTLSEIISIYHKQYGFSVEFIVYLLTRIDGICPEYINIISCDVDKPIEIFHGLSLWQYILRNQLQDIEIKRCFYWFGPLIGRYKTLQSPLHLAARKLIECSGGKETHITETTSPPQCIYALEIFKWLLFIGYDIDDGDIDGTITPKTILHHTPRILKQILSEERQFLRQQKECMKMVDNITYKQYKLLLDDDILQLIEKYAYNKYKRNRSFGHKRFGVDRKLISKSQQIDIIMTYPEKTDHSKSNAKSTGKGNGNDASKQQQNDNNDNNNNSNNNAGGFGGFGGCGKGGDEDEDDKKRNNQRKYNDDDDDEEETDDIKEEEEEIEEERKKEFELNDEHEFIFNADAADFVPDQNYQNKLCINTSRNTLLPVDESKTFELNDNMVWASSNKKIKSVPQNINHVTIYEYEPQTVFRGKRNIKIPEKLINTTLPNRIKKKYCNLYKYIDKTAELSNKHAVSCNDGKTKIISFDFIDAKTDNLLYCVMTKQPDTNKRDWKLMDNVFDSNEIINEYEIDENTLPHSFRLTEEFMFQLNEHNKIKKVLSNIKLMENVIKSCKWHKTTIQKRQNNKQRLTLSLTKEMFIELLTKYVNQTNKEIKLLDTLMFNNSNSNINKYQIVYIWIVRITENTDIGIALRYNEENDSINIHDIHLDKLYLLEQHELVNRNHDCHCLDDFKSNINDLMIGNPDHHKNVAKDYKKRIDLLKLDNITLKTDNTKLSDVVTSLKEEMDKLKTENQELKKWNNEIEEKNNLQHDRNNNNDNDKPEIQISSVSTITSTPSSNSPITPSQSPVINIMNIPHQPMVKGANGHNFSISTTPTTSSLPHVPLINTINISQQQQQGFATRQLPNFQPLPLDVLQSLTMNYQPMIDANGNVIWIIRTN